MTVTFDKRKKDALSKADKSSIGGWDSKIKGLCEKINKSDDYYTASSCAGRIVLIKNVLKKGPGLFVFRTHDKIKLMHLNNPAPNVEFGKHKDQHDIPLFSEEGKFSVREMENIINICNLYDIPMVMETSEMEETLELINEKYKK